MFNVSCIEICDNGIDDDGNGQVDCDDFNCFPAQIHFIDAQGPVNCPILDNGQIIIQAGGEALEYSIDGVNFQPENFFTGLTAGTYQVIAKNIISGCEDMNEVLLEDVSCELDNVVIDIIDVTCFGGNNGSIVATAFDGAQPYIYSLEGQSSSFFGGYFLSLIHI